MNRAVTSILTILLVAACAFLGLYATDVIGGDSISRVDEKEFDSGDFTFSGGIKNGLFDAYGSIAFDNGDIYNGDFTDGRFNGWGDYRHNDNSHKNEWRFNGIFEDGQSEGGTFYLGSNTVRYEKDRTVDTLTGQTWSYSGSFNEHGQKGIGSFTFADGSKYTGGFLRGLADGEGRYVDAAGNIVYAGTFKNGLFEGQGIYNSPEGWSYKGSFKAGLFDGAGLIVKGSVVVRGIWDRGIQIERYE